MTALAIVYTEFLYHMYTIAIAHRPGLLLCPDKRWSLEDYQTSPSIAWSHGCLRQGGSTSDLLCRETEAPRLQSDTTNQSETIYPIQLDLRKQCLQGKVS